VGIIIEGTPGNWPRPVEASISDPLVTKVLVALLCLIKHHHMKTNWEKVV
jgi:hypothetical protein